MCQNLLCIQLYAVIVVFRRLTFRHVVVILVPILDAEGVPHWEPIAKFICITLSFCLNTKRHETVAHLHSLWA
jgi:hypothetical protein